MQDEDEKRIVCYSLNVTMLKKLADFKFLNYAKNTEMSVIVEEAILEYIKNYQGKMKNKKKCDD